MQEIYIYLVSKSSGGEYFKFYPKMLKKIFHDNQTEFRLQQVHLGSDYNKQFFFYIKIIASKVEMFGCNEHPLTTNSFLLHIFALCTFVMAV